MAHTWLLSRRKTFPWTALLKLLLSFLGNGSLAGGKQFNFNEPGKLETFMLHIPRISGSSTAAALPLYARVRERLRAEQEKGVGFVL